MNETLQTWELVLTIIGILITFIVGCVTIWVKLNEKIYKIENNISTHNTFKDDVLKIEQNQNKFFNDFYTDTHIKVNLLQNESHNNSRDISAITTSLTKLQETQTKLANDFVIETRNLTSRLHDLNTTITVLNELYKKNNS